MRVLKCKMRAPYKSCLPPLAANSRGRLFPERGKMVTQPGAQEKPPLCSFRKVSKPLMEKKRRARINVSLEQLKALLEKHYSHQIRKRKLEKADILELSVKYMKSLQLSAQGAPLLTSADYQAGFRSCLQGVNQFLLRSEEAGEASYFHLLQQLARALPGAPGPDFSTTDSGAQGRRPETRSARPRGLGGEQGPRAGGSRPSTQPRAPGKSSAQPPGRPESRARTDGPQQGPCVPGRSQALWRPW